MCFLFYTNTAHRKPFGHELGLESRVCVMVIEREEIVVQLGTLLQIHWCQGAFKIHTVVPGVGFTLTNRLIY